MTEINRIQVLPAQVVKRIAAGEVIERPASVLKELLDNAIDAGASRISVAVEGGGSELIRIADDGCGMSAEDLQLAVKPHATSKIRSDADLDTISTMGFRGEALASISAVAKLRISSRPRGSDEGHEIYVVEEEVESDKAAGCPGGTTIEVRDLFFNVPARRRFLRAKSTEMGHLNEQFARAALSHPHIAFEMTAGGRTTQNLPACDHRLERIARFYGVELAADLLHISREERGVAIEAFLAPPSHARSSAQWQYVYVNHRYIRDKFIQHAIKEAYRGLMEPNRFGVVFLFITVQPAAVDVNVHPTKIEVRWADSGLIHSQVLSALRETLQRADLTPQLRTDRAGGREVSEEEADQLRLKLADALKSATPEQGGTVEGRGFTPAFVDRGLGLAPGPSGALPGSAGLSGRESWSRLYAPVEERDEPPPGLGSAPQPGQPFPPAGGGSEPRPTAPEDDFRVVQMHNLYLVAETADGIVIIDQHALHERVMYEQLRARIAEGDLESQRLLLPETIRVTPHERGLLEENQELLEQLGIEAAPSGEESVMVHAFPAILRDTEVSGFMRELLDKLRHTPVGTTTEVVIHELLDMMACKAAVKAGDSLSQVEIQDLLRQRALVEKSSSCPHGRPTMLRLSKADLERQFKRA